jgi:hypothetical protein
MKHPNYKGDQNSPFPDRPTSPAQSVKASPLLLFLASHFTATQNHLPLNLNAFRLGDCDY